ncbi:pituitary tumor-transforming gene 1 protein-interacting protein isoform X1 [Prionailurus iriomotensis]
MAFGGTRGLVPRWELPVGVAALLLLLFSVTAAQEPSVAACSQNTNRTCEECLKNVSVNFEALIITLSVVGGAVLLALAACCCACCCRRKRSRKPDKEEEKAAREREERRVRQEERRAEMKSRHDEIRKKYGLFKEENPYARFENN